MHVAATPGAAGHAPDRVLQVWDDGRDVNCVSHVICIQSFRRIGLLLVVRGCLQECAHVYGLYIYLLFIYIYRPYATASGCGTMAIHRRPVNIAVHLRNI